MRDRAIILVGYAGAFRRAELASIEAAHVTLNADGMEIFVPKAKTDPRTVGINFARNADFYPVRTLREWMNAAGIEEGPIFRAVTRSAETAGLDREDVAGHCLRRDHLMQGALNGADLNRLMKQAGHAGSRTTAGYVEDTKRMETNTSRDLGL